LGSGWLYQTSLVTFVAIIPIVIVLTLLYHSRLGSNISLGA
jgi:hypothetical protein